MNDDTELRTMVNEYFTGLHHGNADQLAPLFHSDCVLKSPESRCLKEEWLKNVSNRPIPAAIGHPWEYHIIWLELEGDQAMAKVSCPLPHGRFIDYLGFLKENGSWRIVNKMYATTVRKL